MTTKTLKASALQTAQVAPPTADVIDACKRAARALTSYLGVSGEKPLGASHLALIRALLMAEVYADQPLRDPERLMGLVAHFFTPIQLEFAVELVGECLMGMQGEGEAMLAELDLVAREVEAEAEVAAAAAATAAAAASARRSRTKSGAR